jgi:uncharacterized membrane protein YraQ (UPF0718 family)
MKTGTGLPVLTSVAPRVTGAPGALAGAIAEPPGRLLARVWHLWPLLAAWLAVYASLGPAARWLTADVLGLNARTRLGAAVEFFVFDTPKVMLLLVLVVFAIGVVRTYITPARVRALLAGRRESAGNVMAATLGIVTPFCSCSAVPLFIGFLESGIPLGVTFSFLIAAPMINEVAVVLLWGLVGAQAAGLYVLTGLVVAIGAGWVIGRLQLERQVEAWVHKARLRPELSAPRLSWPQRLHAGRVAVGEIVRKVWPYIVAGIAVGAGIHGYVPQEALAGILGRDAWWGVPAAVVIGVPLYSNAAGMIPVAQALLGKGAALGAVLAFVMAVTALSVPELVILRRVLRPVLLAVFVAVVSAGIILVGYLFNALL